MSKESLLAIIERRIALVKSHPRSFGPNSSVEMVLLLLLEFRGHLLDLEGWGARQTIERMQAFVAAEFGYPTPTPLSVLLTIEKREQDFDALLSRFCDQCVAEQDGSRT